MTLLLLYISLALGISFLCSIMEAVLLSLTPAYIVQIEESRPKLSKRLRRYKDDVEEPLAAILSLNTIAHTVGAAGAGAEATALYGEAYIGVISGVLTLLILLFSEILPKTLGTLYWRQLTPTVARLLRLTLFCMYPLVKMARIMTVLLSRGKSVPRVNRDEIRALAKLGVKEGVIMQNESEILFNLLRFRKIMVKDIMTPRTVLFSLNEQMTVAESFEKEPDIPFSRIPVYGENQDDITGFVLKTDLLMEVAKDHNDTKLVDIKRPIIAVYKNVSLHNLFDSLLNNRSHIALVIDEYGGTEGLVTQEDLIETLLGMEIVDEGDREEDMRKLARRQWEKRAKQMGINIEESGE